MLYLWFTKTLYYSIILDYLFSHTLYTLLHIAFISNQSINKKNTLILFQTPLFYLNTNITFCRCVYIFMHQKNAIKSILLVRTVLVTLIFDFSFIWYFFLVDLGIVIYLDFINYYQLLFHFLFLYLSIFFPIYTCIHTYTCPIFCVYFIYNYYLFNK